MIEQMREGLLARGRAMSLQRGKGLEKKLKKSETRKQNQKIGLQKKSFSVGGCAACGGGESKHYKCLIKILYLYKIKTKLWQI